MVWDVTPLQQIYPASTYPAIETSLVSIQRCAYLLLYHLNEARDSMTGIFSGVDHEDAAFIFNLSPRQQEYDWAKIKNEASLIAAVNMVRSFADIFSTLINDVGLAPRLGDRDVSITTIAKRLPAGPLKAALDDLRQSPAFQYVEDFSNLSKHRQLVPHGGFVSFESKSSGVRLAAFTKDGRTHASKSSEEVDQYCVEVAKMVVNCGNVLNEAVIAQQAMAAGS